MHLSNISAVQNNTNTNFKQCNKIILPSNIIEGCGDIFIPLKEAGNIIGKRPIASRLLPAIIDRSTSVFGRNLTNAWLQFEMPSFYTATLDLQDNPYSMEWLKLHLDLPIADKIEKDFHTLFVLTKEDKANMKESIKNNKLESSEDVEKSIEKFPGSSMQDLANKMLYQSINLALRIDNSLKQILESTNVKTFEINSIEEIRNIKPELGL